MPFLFALLFLRSVLPIVLLPLIVGLVYTVVQILVVVIIRIEIIIIEIVFLFGLLVVLIAISVLVRDGRVSAAGILAGF